MGSVYPRKNKLWLRYKGEDGKWTQCTTPFARGQERQARALLKRVETRVSTGAAHGDSKGPLTVREYADQWGKERRALGLADAKGDEGRLRKHVLPKIGAAALDEVRPGDLVKLFRGIRLSGKVAPKTIYNIYSVVKALFRDAVIEDLIGTSPAVLTRHQLGPNEDKDPEWRAGAIFTRAELEHLISDEQLPLDRRLLYGLLGIAGLRHGEAAGLRWRHYETDMDLLGRLTVATSYDRGRTKTGRTRYMPVHPTLAAMLAQWKLEGWPAMFGRTPGADDLVAPCPPGGKVRLGTMRKAHNTWLAFQNDLDTLELRRRRVHDLRRTLISLSRMDGARASLLKVCTHGAGKKEMMDAYTTFPWENLCTEVAKLKVQRRRRGELVELKMAASQGEPQGGEPAATGSDTERFATPLATPIKNRRVSAAFPASPTGFEPVSPA